MAERKQHLDTLAVTLLLACCAFWGFQQILIKTTVGEVPPLWQAAIRFVGATAVLWAWCAWRGIRLFESDGTLPAGLLAGALFAAEFTCIYIGLQHTAASRLTVFLSTSPFVVAILLPRLVRPLIERALAHEATVLSTLGTREKSALKNLLAKLAAR